MATTSITKWEIAEMFGLEYLGEDDIGEDGAGGYKFNMKSSTEGLFTIKHWYEAGDEDQAKERAAERLLSAIGRCVVEKLWQQPQ